MAIAALFAAGGVVMWPLTGLSVLSVALIIERSLFWWKVARSQEPVAREALQLYRQHPEAIFAQLARHSDLPLSRIFLAALELEQPTPEDFRLALETAAQAEIPLLKRFSNIFDTIISVSPLLGLLGTVLGLISAFGNLRIGDLGSRTAAGVTSGISAALISTATGLLVAIVTLMFANTFRGLYIRQLALMQEYGGQLELLYRRGYSHGVNQWRSPH